MKICQFCKGDFGDPIEFPNGCPHCKNSGFDQSREKYFCGACKTDQFAILDANRFVICEVCKTRITGEGP